MKHINLESFIEIMESENNSLINSFILLSDEGYDFKAERGMTTEELESFYKLAKLLINKLSFSQREGFILGFKIEKGIREEFDVLRYSDESILNIELKGSIPLDGIKSIKNQLVRHKFLLGVSGKKINVFTYLESENQLYTINENEDLIKVEINNVIDCITKEYLIDDTLKNINLNNMIISPYTQSEDFFSRRYFLNNEQMECRDDILSSKKQNICIYGGPGTGKTLLLFDIAKKYQQEDKKVAIIFCSKMENFEAKKISHQIGIDIIPIKSIKGIKNLEDYDILLADEAQRLYKESFEMFLSIKDKKIIFSVDHQQTLHPAEEQLNIEGLLQEKDNVKKIKLKNKIRTDKAMSSFIQKLLHIKARKIEPYDYDNVQVVYFNNEEHANTYITNMCEKNNYISIEQTEYRTRQTGSNKRKNVYLDSLGTHDVLGREYENVLVLLDRHFYYNEEAYLVSGYTEYYPYLEHKQIFQALTRVKNKLLIVVVDNPELYEIIQKIINWKTNTLLREYKKQNVN